MASADESNPTHEESDLELDPLVSKIEELEIESPKKWKTAVKHEVIN